MTDSLLLRVDASEELGMGHFMRGLALAQAWREATGGPVRFLAATLPPAALDRLAAEGFGCDLVADEDALLARIAESPEAWLAIDGRHFSADEVMGLAIVASRCLMIDDHGALDHYGVDLIVNPNLFAEPRLYDGRCPAMTQRLCGARYALLRRELRHAVADHAPRPDGPLRILLTLGGSDPHHLTIPLARAILRASGDRAETTAVIGPGGREPDLSSLGAAERSRLTVLRQPPDWPAPLAASDLAVSAAGTTLLELAALGVPALWVSNNEGEEAAASQAEAAGCGRYLAPVTDLDDTALAAGLSALLDDPDRRAAMAAAGRRLVDGAGAARVVEAMLSMPWAETP